MYNRTELEEALHLFYPDVLTKCTNQKRLYNITNLIEFILEDIKANNLEYGVKERRIKLYCTSHNESIYIQYPGMYSVNDRLPFDFRPIAVLSDGTTSIDMDFEFIWRIIEKYIDGHKNLMGIINSLLFRMGRMYDYVLDETTLYKSEFVLNDLSNEPAENIKLPLFKMNFNDSKIVESLNFHGETIDAGNNNSMSLEAFLYYFELLLQIEDCKYNKDKKISDAGRISSSDSLIVISSYTNNEIDLANMLMRFVRYRGVARCTIDEYPKVTNNIVSIINYKNHFEMVCEQNNIPYSNKRIFKYAQSLITTKLQIEAKRILITEESPSLTTINEINTFGWNVYDVNDYFLKGSLDELDYIIINSPFIFDFDNELERIKREYSLSTSKRTLKISNLKVKPYCFIENYKILILDSILSETEINILHDNGYNVFIKSEIDSFEKFDLIKNIILS